SGIRHQISVKLSDVRLLTLVRPRSNVGARLRNQINEPKSEPTDGYALTILTQTTERTLVNTNHMAYEEEVARPERFELPTTWFEVRFFNCNLLL
ncbi:MAG: hypothetical protein V3S73_02495, partial [Gammaproteobacteria bacterium]